MTGWDVLSNVVDGFPPVAMALLLVVAIVAAIAFVIGFSRNGIDFVRHGFKQSNITELGEKIDAFRTELRGEIDSLRTELKAEFSREISEVRGEIGGLRTELETIKVNHFGHLKNFLTEMTSILLDKGIINNENKARLDNQLRDM
ncbi:MAG: prominin family protein [Spirochaetaceae bacterium]|jgi:hypothetical protein|nr:prominin family protein [Spirochaetaceae bacterium]